MIKVVTVVVATDKVARECAILDRSPLVLGYSVDSDDAVSFISIWVK